MLVGLYHMLELNQTSKLDISSTSNFPLPYHFVAGPGSLTLELCKLSPVVDGDKQLPDGQERKSNQEDTADHDQEDGHGIGGSSTLWRGPGGTMNKVTSISAPHPLLPSGVSEMKGTSLSQRSSLYSLSDPHTTFGRPERAGT